MIKPCTLWKKTEGLNKTVLIKKCDNIKEEKAKEELRRKIQLKEQGIRQINNETAQSSNKADKRK